MFQSVAEHLGIAELQVFDLEVLRGQLICVGAGSELI